MKFERRCKKEVVDSIQAISDGNCDIRLYGGDGSLRSWDRDKYRKHYETIDEAHKRSEREAEKIRDGKKRKKDHTGNLNSYCFDSELLTEASSWDNFYQPDFSKLGRQYVTKKKDNTIPSNCGQVVKDYLLQQEVEGRIHLEFFGKNEEPKKRIRKAKRKVGKKSLKLSVLVEKASAKVKVIKDNKVKSGEIDMGVNVVRREYHKLSIDRDGNISKKTFYVEGCKHPLTSIREKLFLKHHKYMRLNSNTYFENLPEDIVSESVCKPLMNSTRMKMLSVCGKG